MAFAVNDPASRIHIVTWPHVQSTNQSIFGFECASSLSSPVSLPKSRCMDAAPDCKVTNNESQIDGEFSAARNEFAGAIQRIHQPVLRMPEPVTNRRLVFCRNHMQTR